MFNVGDVVDIWITDSGEQKRMCNCEITYLPTGLGDLLMVKYGGTEIAFNTSSPQFHFMRKNNGHHDPKRESNPA